MIRNYVRAIREEREMARTGWTVRVTQTRERRPDGRRVRVAYTVGLTAKGLPELGVIGCPPRYAWKLLHAAAGYVITAGEAEPGPFPCGIFGHLTARLTDSAAARKAMPAATALYGDTVRGLWLWPPGAVNNQDQKNEKELGHGRPHHP